MASCEGGWITGMVLIATHHFPQAPDAEPISFHLFTVFWIGTAIVLMFVTIAADFLLGTVFLLAATVARTLLHRDAAVRS